MSTQSILQQILADNEWEIFQPLMDRVQQWPYWTDFMDRLAALNREALYVSPVHGEGHIERTMLHGAFCAMEDELSRADTLLLLDACAYHDVGRINDWVDAEHGHRSAQRLGSLTGRSGQELTMLMAAVDAHSRNDNVLEETLTSYAPEDYPRTLLLAQLLKDADGLDRVRIHDLDTRYLRRPASAGRADFALYLFSKYQLYYAKQLPYFNRSALGMQLAKHEKRDEAQ